MSAHKSAIVRLGESEYQRLRESEEKLRLLDLNNALTSNNFDQASIYEQMVGDNQQRDRQFLNIFESSNRKKQRKDNNQLEENLWLGHENHKLQNRIQQLERSTSDWANQITFEMEFREKQLEQKYYEQTEMLLQKNNNDIEDTHREIERAILLLDFLQEEYLFDLVSANELEIHRNEIEHAQFQLQSGRDDRAWMCALTAITGLVQLRHHLESQRTIFSACRSQLLTDAKNVVDRIQNNQVINAMDADGAELSEKIDVDYWTEGAYQTLVAQAAQAEEAVQLIEGNDLNELSEWREEFKILDERSLDVITQARLAVLASQLRFNVAQIVVQALETQGFYLEEAAYQQNDFRSSFMARTRSLSGSEVLVTIDPDPGLDEGGRVHIDSDDAQPVTEHELLQRNREIFNAIRHQGLVVGETKQISTEKVPLKPLRTKLQVTTKK